MKVSDGMTTATVTVGPGHTLRAAARTMAEHRTGAAIVLDPEAPGPGIVTERDILRSIGAGEDPDVELVGEHQSDELVFAAPNWSLEQAAAEMVRHHIRHLVVIEGADIVGMLSVRDIVRCWTTDGATVDVLDTPSASRAL